ncbi:hypothetical protein CAMSH0001_1629 [Campylobacter showae RM3277]|uniref:Uncharacterized protein n=1 Tax=Campylobacter showae RM3277 TaxID=553219 RepID=C6RGZ5_9BACT|nr:hypothetical protein CAMSH0001_1629 [Campylobacter showae RM3277]
MKSNFTRQDPHRKIDKFKFATLCVSKAVSPHLSRAVGLVGFLRRCASSCKQTGAGLPSAVASA